MARRWPTLPPGRTARLVAAGGAQWYALWQARTDLAAVPPVAWGWCPAQPLAPLSVPAGLLSTRRTMLPMGALVRSLAAWALSGPLPAQRRYGLYFLLAFARAARLDRYARRQLLQRVREAMRTQQREHAAALRAEAVVELGHRCHQAVDCRGLWAADPSVTAVELRREIETVLHAPSSAILRQETHASWTQGWMLGTDVLIQRYRHDGRSGTWWQRRRGSTSTARQHWLELVVQHRLGRAPAPPLGLLEILHEGRVSESVLVTRPTPGQEPH